MAEERRETHGTCVCPWWLMYFFDHRVRALVQPAAPVVAPLVSEGHSCLDLGCGMGYFTVPLARLVGPTGHVTAVDIQPKMLQGAARRLEREGLADRVSLRAPGDPDWMSAERYDSILAFWMLHEVRDRQELLETLRRVLKPTGQFLLVEPRLHVGERLWEESLELAEKAGFGSREARTVKFSRAVVLR